MKIYTKTGDRGITTLCDDKRTRKEELFFSVIGEIEELSSRIDVLLCLLEKDETIKKELISLYLHKIRVILQVINSSITKKSKVLSLKYDIVDEIEKMIDSVEKSGGKFILSSDSLVEAYVNMCRAQTRKVERKAWKLHNSNKEIEIIKIITFCNGTFEPIEKSKEDLSLFKFDNSVLTYLNRLSDFFLVLTRCMGKIKGFQ